ncbi:glycosyltransferase [Lichenifustis flavocetrariae]|uniref:Glycosyltransferase n=1 Tax=Lichenifustis flavocetrariae TaxID=2949735 RepID=A0AA41YZL0_9HYPH|nr:glycosyltransferase [Lichenifustis flavocetrariae]MCW6510147.1 glycosyltransferase [Lichenifustis flavocetrariae]
MSARKTLLIYTHALAGGGAERVCSLLATGFVRQGWRVLIAVDAEDDANQRFLDPDIEIAVLGSGHLRTVGRLVGLLRRENPDITLSAIGVSNLKHVMAATLCGRLARAVLSYHAFAASEPQRLSRAAYWLLPVLSRLTARTVAVSHGLHRDLVARWRASPRRVTTIYNPVMVGTGAPAAPRPTGTPPMILSAGRLVPDKNMRAVVRAFGRIAARCEARLMILGEGPDRPAIQDEILRLGLEKRVELHGYVPEPWALYQQAACFVTASRLESFSMVIAEALAYGVPVVAYDSPGPREVLDDGKYGALIPLDDEECLASAMLAALQNPPDAMLLQERGRAFSVEVGVEAYHRLFCEVIAEAAGETRVKPASPSASRFWAKHG